MTHHRLSGAPLDWEQLDRFLAGACDPDEAHALLASFDPAERERLMALCAELKHRPARDRDVEALLTRFHHRMASATATSARRPGARRWSTTMAAAAAAACCGVVALVLWTRGHDWHARSNPSGVSRVYATHIGQRAVVTLTDGSRVTLAPQTTLRVATEFGGATRTVSLQGEAMFDVATASHTPFIVDAGQVSTRVLGTTFDVRSYPTDHDVRVAVTTGKVAVSAAKTHTALVVVAGGVVRASDSAVATVSGDASQYVAWASGHLVFRDAPTLDVFAALTRWYGYQFRVTDSALLHQNLNVRLSTESLPTALATLKLALDAELTFDGTMVTVRPRLHGANAAPAPRDRRAPLFPSNLEVGR
jgi:ferric-dicitrate binding protein FerR (iron transport regulator)